MASRFCGGVAVEFSPRREPWGPVHEGGSPGGAEERSASRGDFRLLRPYRGYRSRWGADPRLAPWALILRPSRARPGRPRPENAG